jgi:hypothetical protein
MGLRGPYRREVLGQVFVCRVGCYRDDGRRSLALQTLQRLLHKGTVFPFFCVPVCVCVVTNKMAISFIIGHGVSDEA